VRDPVTTQSRPGVLSRVLGWADRLPGHGWWIYPLLYALSLAWSHAVVWATGQAPFGEFQPLLVVGHVYAPFLLGAMAYINGSSGRALASFWPATGWPNDEREAWRHRFVTSPARWDPAMIAIGIGVAVVAFLSAPATSLPSGDRTILFIAYLPPAALGYVAALLAIVHSAYQLRLVARIHRQATAIDPFDRVSLYAFSSLTAQTGVVYVLIGYYALTFNGAFQAGNVTAIVMLGAAFAIGVACFVLPLWGIHDRLVHEKELLLRDVEVRVSRLGEEIYRRIDAGQFDGTKVVTDSLAGVTDLRKRIVDIPTWPWRPQVLSGFLSALLLPVAVFLITRALASQLGS
jgi:hypothetical protein